MTPFQVKRRLNDDLSLRKCVCEYVGWPLISDKSVISEMLIEQQTCEASTKKEDFCRLNWSNED